MKSRVGETFSAPTSEPLLPPSNPSCTNYSLRSGFWIELTQKTRQVCQGFEWNRAKKNKFCSFYFVLSSTKRQRTKAEPTLDFLSSDQRQEHVDSTFQKLWAVIVCMNVRIYVARCKHWTMGVNRRANVLNIYIKLSIQFCNGFCDHSPYPHHPHDHPFIFFLTIHWPASTGCSSGIHPRSPAQHPLPELDPPQCGPACLSWIQLGLLHQLQGLPVSRWCISISIVKSIFGSIFIR